MIRLKKHIGYLCLISLLGFAPCRSVAMSPDNATPGSIKMTVEGSEVRVLNASRYTLEVYDLTGKRVAAHRIDSPEKTITLTQQRGCYILKVGNTTRKISIY